VTVVATKRRRRTTRIARAGDPVCDAEVRHLDDPRLEQRCVALPHSIDEPHIPGPWSETRDVERLPDWRERQAGGR
jgi:hypothetical protein